VASWFSAVAEKTEAPLCFYVELAAATGLSKNKALCIRIAADLLPQVRRISCGGEDSARPYPV